MSSKKKVEFKTMTNFDDSEQSEQQEVDQSMEQEIRSAGNGAFDRSDIMYMLEIKSVQHTAEEAKKKKLEEEVANFKVSSLNKKPTAVIAMKEKRHIAPTPAVVIKKKRLKIDNNGDREKSEAQSSKSGITPSSGTDIIKAVKEKAASSPVVEKPKPVTGALSGLMGEYSDSDSDSW